MKVSIHLKYVIYSIPLRFARERGVPVAPQRLCKDAALPKRRLHILRQRARVPRQGLEQVQDIQLQHSKQLDPIFPPFLRPATFCVFN